MALDIIIIQAAKTASISSPVAYL